MAQVTRRILLVGALGLFAANGFAQSAIPRQVSPPTPRVTRQGRSTPLRPCSAPSRKRRTTPRFMSVSRKDMHSPINRRRRSKPLSARSPWSLTDTSF